MPDTKEKFEICAHKARRVKSCKDCLYYGRCQAVGKPCSRLGLYFAYLDEIVLPYCEAVLPLMGFKRVDLVSRLPTMQELNKGAYVTIVAHWHNTKCIAFTCLIDDAFELDKALFYIKRRFSRLPNNGKGKRKK